MGGDPSDRLRWKEPLYSLEVELQRDFGLTPVSSRALLRRIAEFLDTFVTSPDFRGAGQICYPAVAIGERAGKPIKHCLTIPTTVTLLHSSDSAVLHDDGSPALRRTRLERICLEAYQQGAALSHEDLALLLALDLSTVRRLVADCADQGSRPPTRGVIQDIGPTLSHKEQTLRLYFAGLFPGHIAARTGHSLGSVERYLADFARVVQLHQQEVPTEAIARLTGLSQRLVQTYVDLFHQYDRPAHRPVFDRLLSRFGCCQSVQEV